jgi:hypothetical protein
MKIRTPLTLLGILLVVVALQLTGAAGGKLMARPMPAGAATGTPPDGTTGKGGLHLPRDKRVNFNYELTDGGGFRWDIQYYGNVGQGTNYAYSSGVYSQVSGNNISSNGTGFVSKDGDEVEIGPYQINQMRCYRRVKVYKDAPLARWIDIFENTSGQEQTIQVQVTTNLNNTVGRTDTSSGGSDFGEKDWAFITEQAAGGPANAPSVAHIVCDQRSKLRPTVQISGNSIYVRYSVTVPASGVACICYFESQNNSIEAQKKTLAGFRSYKYLKDLAPAVRKLILNMSSGSGGPQGIDLERLEESDLIMQVNGDPLKGVIKNNEFIVTTFYGKMTLPAKEVVGMVAGVGEDEPFRAVLVDGQVICGMTPPDQKVQLDLPSGGTLNVPIEKVSQWSYKISKERPDETVQKAALLVLRTGDRLGFDPKSLKLSFRTQHGNVSLDPSQLLEINLDNAGNGVHRATFINGSTLAGFLEPDKLDLQVKLGPKLQISRDVVSQIRFASDEKEDAALSQVQLSNGDELLGELAEEKLKVATEYGELEVKPANIRSMSFSPVHLGRVVMELWDGTIIRGQLTQQELAWQIVPGPKISVSICQFTKLVRAHSQPPGQLKEQVEKLIGQLGAESYLDRQKATEDLTKMGKAILPLLQSHLKDNDPEIRQRVADIIEALGGNVVEQPVMIEGEINMPGMLQMAD